MQGNIGLWCLIIVYFLISAKKTAAIILKESKLSNTRYWTGKRTELSILKKYSQPSIKIPCYVLDQLPIFLDPLLFEIFRNLKEDLKLADPNFHLGGFIDVIIGSDIFWDSLLPK